MTKKEEKKLKLAIYSHIALIAGAGLVLVGCVLWGVGEYATTQVKKELGAQNIYFPPKGSAALDPKEFPDLQKYAGQKVDDGPKAQAYANGFIGRHLEKVADGKTYAEVSALSMKDPKNEELQKQKQSLFQGETLRGILLGNGYAYWTMGVLAKFAAISCGVAAALLGLVVLRGSLAKRD